MIQTGRPYFDQWDMTEQVLQPRPIYSLTPCGLGTPLVESLSSYVIRLAEAHVASVWRLILHVLQPPRFASIPRSSPRYAYPANGLGKASESFIDAFETATQRTNLRSLTLSALESCISQPGTFRTTQAWCAACLKEWRAADSPLYIPLLWTLQAVIMCPIHKRPLVDRCPHCQSRFAPLRAKALPGRCPICLGEFCGADTRPISVSGEDQCNLWSSIAIGELLEALPRLQKYDLAGAFRENLYRCLEQTPGATRADLAMRAGAAPCAFRGWVTGGMKPTLDHLCRLCHHSGLPLLYLFQGIPAGWQGRPGLHHENRRCQPGLPPAIERSKLREVLIRSLNENPAPSVAEIARRLKLRRAQTLWSREPDLCSQISARRRGCGVKPSSVTQVYPRSKRQDLERALRRFLSQRDPPSLNEIAARLQYKGSSSIRERFPELCRAITIKRRQVVSRKWEHIRLAIESARTEVPPPSLKRVGRRLGYTCEVVISAMFPALCDSYKEWRSAWLEEQRQTLLHAIRDWVATEPAPTVKSVCRQFGISPAYFQLRFPEDNKELVRRSAERVHKARADRARVLGEEVSHIVLDLRKKGLYPSLPRVRSELPPGSTRYSPVIRAAIHEARSTVDVWLRPRNELGRFV